MNPCATAETLVLPNVYGIVIRERGQLAILIQKRWKPQSDPANLGLWELPGGKWRSFEPALVCLKRELEEESGIEDIAPLRQSIRYSHRGQTVEVTNPDFCVQMVHGPYPSLLAVYCVSGVGEPKSDGDGSREAQWMLVGELKDRLMSEPENFTPLSYSCLMEAIKRDVL